MQQTSHESDPYWQEDIILFDGTFQYYRNKPHKVFGKFHFSDETYRHEKYEIIPLKTKKGTRTYVMMHAYVAEPNLQLTIAIKPKTYADMGETLGKVKSSEVQGVREIQVGSAQAWYVRRIGAC